MEPTVPAATRVTALSRTMQLAFRPPALAAALALGCVATLLPTQAGAATYYIGPFSGAQPTDEPGCGTGKGSSPGARPCASLSYWTQNRRQALSSGDTVRLAPGNYRGSGGLHCIMLDRSGVTYEGRSATDTPISNYTDVVIDMGAASTGSGPCFANGVMMQGSGASNVTVRNLKIKDANTANTGSGASRWRLACIAR